MTRKPPLGSQVFQKEFFPATTMPDKSWWSVLWPNPDSTVRTLGIKAEMMVVDLCCGDGHFTAALAELVNGKVYALDIPRNAEPGTFRGHAAGSICYRVALRRRAGHC
jgi:FtsJ-like methyltransferase